MAASRAFQRRIPSRLVRRGTFRGGRPRIVLADDNANMRAYAERRLGRDHQVVAVGDGAAALDALRKAPADLLLARRRPSSAAVLRSYRASLERTGARRWTERSGRSCR